MEALDGTADGHVLVRSGSSSMGVAFNDAALDAQGAQA